MKHYKNLKNEEVFGFDDDQLHLVTNDMVEMTAAEFHDFCNPTPTPEQLAERAKVEAQAYLASTDWVEPYLIKHYTGIELLPLDSDKFLIEQKRKEAIELLK